MRLNLDEPRYDQSTFEGRAKYFFSTTNPLNVLASNEELEKAKFIVESVKADTLPSTYTDDQIWAAKELYDSAYHCQTGEQLFLPGKLVCFKLTLEDCPLS